MTAPHPLIDSPAPIGSDAAAAAEPDHGHVVGIVPILVARSRPTEALLHLAPFDDPASTVVAESGREALGLGLAQSFGAIVLDTALPLMSGLSVCEQLRQAGVETPIVFLVSGLTIAERIRALDLGADDVVATPFAPSELAARIRARARRPLLAGSSLRCDDLVLDRVSHVVSRAGAPILLSPREYALLETLMLNPGRVFSRDELLHRVWGSQPPGGNCVDVYVGYLRQKIDKPFGRANLGTIRGAGYVLRGEVSEERRPVSPQPVWS